MSAHAGAPPVPVGGRSGLPFRPLRNMSRTKKILYGTGVVWIGGTIALAAAFGLKSHKAPSVANSVFSPTDEFKLDTWFNVGPIDFNKGVLFVLLTAALTIGIMWWVASRMQARPNRVQMSVEWLYGLSRSMTRDNMDPATESKYFPLIATLFVFILVTNLISYIPLPIESTNKFDVFGVSVPAFQIYAADTNLAFPLVLTLGVLVLFVFEGVRHHGPIGYLRSLTPAGVGGALLPVIFGLELLSTFVLRPVSLCVRLWANLLAGHWLIAFMSGELGVLVGQPFIAWFLLPLGIAIYLFEALLIAGLQAFIFAILTAIYIGGAVTEH
jgi:F-type H+-transporting ATPase subunit a